MSDIVIPKGDYVGIVKPIHINPFGYCFINIKRGSRLRLSEDLKIGDTSMQYAYSYLMRNMARPLK